MSAAKRAWTAVLLLVIVLGSGVGIGIALGRTWLAPMGARLRTETPAEKVVRLVDRFRGTLALDAAQATTIAEALTRSHADRAVVRERIAPELRVARERLRARILAVLTEAQRAKYAEMVKRYDARRRSQPQ